MYKGIYDLVSPKYPFNRYSTKQLLTWFEDCCLQYAVICEQQALYPSGSDFQLSMENQKSSVLNQRLLIREVLIDRKVTLSYLTSVTHKIWSDVHGD